MTSPEATSIFNQTKSFLDGVQALNAAKEDDVTTCFTMLCANGGNDREDRETIGVDVRLKDTLSTILDRVAYFPARPADMKVSHVLNVLFITIVSVYFLSYCLSVFSI